MLDYWGAPVAPFPQFLLHWTVYGSLEHLGIFGAKNLIISKE